MKKILLGIFIIIQTLIVNQIVHADEYLFEENEIEIGQLLMGDVDNNSVVNATDALKILKIVAKCEEMDNKFSIRQNDFNKDYLVDATDALSVLKTASRLVDTQTITDPLNFFRDVEYKDGYPLYDYISYSLDAGLYISCEYGIIENSSWLFEMYSINESIFDTSIAISSRNYDENLEKYYWNIIWMIQDALLEGCYLPTDLDVLGIGAGEDSEFSFTGYNLRLKGYAKIGGNFQSKILLYISENNEIYFEVSNRCDMMSYTDKGILYKYEGEIPECLNYSAVDTYYSNLK